MTTPDTPEWGQHAGPEGSAQRERYQAEYARINELMQANAVTIQQLAATGIAGADLVAQVTRLTTLIDTLFGTLEGTPGLIDMGDSTQRLMFEELCQGRIANTLAGITKMVEDARQAAGQTHQRQSGLFVAGRGTKVNGSN